MASVTPDQQQGIKAKIVEGRTDKQIIEDITPHPTVILPMATGLINEAIWHLRVLQEQRLGGRNLSVALTQLETAGLWIREVTV